MVQTQISPSSTCALEGKFSKEQLAWLDKAKTFASSISLEEVIASDKENVFRRDLFEKACQPEWGLGGLPFPSTYGGSAGDYVSFSLVNEEFGRRCVPIMSSLGVHVLSQEPIYRFGNDEQKKKYLMPSSSGQMLAAFGLTEPNAGSDTAAIETTAKINSNGDYLLNGTKTFITSGASADYYIVMARLLDNTEQSDKPAETGKAKRPGQITAFIVERNFEGFAIGQKFDMLGMRGYSTCEIVFNDCLVPKANLLGQHGEGRKVALSSLAKGRVTIAAQSIGWAQGALDACLVTLQKHYRDGAITADANGMAGKLGDLAVQIEAARVLTFQAARLIDANEQSVTVAAMAKTMASDVAMRVSTEVMSILGMDGMKPELLIERIFRDAKAGQIYEGTNQIQRMLIARDLLK
ncbi:MAG: acyl-CoA dehydrogenase family protein [Candidatus Melainabacteria bacterium]|nr:acyl-CoA dehydrogenase family protein [Candidatus Melainabacteria bacterium]